MDETFVIVTLDGGAASGKSSTGRALVERYPFLHVDTGLHYRALTLCLLQEGIDPEKLLKQDSLEKDRFKDLLESIALSTQIQGKTAKMQIHGSVFEEAPLKSPEVNAWVSPLASLPELRGFLRGYQRSLVDLAKEKSFKGIVMEGRDIGSAILPEAPYKFFLCADVKLRQARRNLEGLHDDIQKRDASDSQRPNAPLVCPERAIVIDTSHQDLEAVVETIVGYLPAEFS